jgi:hydrogenase/urease accessory protein HupE
VGLAALFWLSAAGAEAHQSGVSTVRIDITDDQIGVELAVKGIDLDAALGTDLVDPETDQVRPDRLAEAADRVSAFLIAGASVSHGDGTPCEAAPDAPVADADGVILWVAWRCQAGAVDYRNRLFLDQDPLALQNVLVLRGDDMAPSVMTGEHDTLRLTDPPPSAFTVIGRYVGSGIEHIWVGYDHIAFLIALLLWARRLWPVVKVVTAFTIAHSITLALAVLDVVSLPPSLVEPLIAVSIIWVAAENFFSENVARRWKVTFLLGLVHGFGFAGVLRDFGLPNEALGLALASFNIGVEIGQVAIVAVAVPVLLGIDKIMRRDTRSRALVVASSLFIAGMGVYWLVARTVLA